MLGWCRSNVREKSKLDGGRKGADKRCAGEGGGINLKKTEKKSSLEKGEIQGVNLKHGSHGTDENVKESLKISKIRSCDNENQPVLNVLISVAS